MTELEHRLRLVRPRLVPAALVTTAAVLAGAGIIGCGQRASHAPGAGTGADPPLVAIEVLSRGSHARLELISPKTGRVVKVVAQFGTGNGFALAPDSKNMYVVGSVRSTIEIRRVSTATGKVSFVADGAYPAISPDGRYLAYVTGRGFTSLAVRDLQSGRTRAIDLRSLLGSNGNLLNQGGVSWLGDGGEVVVVPGFPVSAAAAGRKARTGAGIASRHRVPPGRQSLIIVRTSSDKLAAHRIVVPDPYEETFGVVSGDVSRPRSFLIARPGYGGAGTITRVSLRGRGYQARVIARLPTGVMPVVIAPRGDWVLYLAGQSPSALWAAAIGNSGLTGQHRLFAGTNNLRVDQAAW
jgi:hypothetical protein